MEEPRPLDGLNKMIGKEVKITLKNGSMFEGVLKAFDIHTNIVLEKCKMISPENKVHNNATFFAGYSIEQCSVL